VGVGVGASAGAQADTPKTAKTKSKNIPVKPHPCGILTTSHIMLVATTSGRINPIAATHKPQGTSGLIAMGQGDRHYASMVADLEPYRPQIHIMEAIRFSVHSSTYC